MDQKQLETVEYFSYLGRRITNDARCTLDIKSRIAMAKAAFGEEKALLTRKMDLHLRAKPVKRNIWSIALCGAGTGLKHFEMWCWRWTEKISWTACVKVKKYCIESRRRVISYRQ
jgi:hypothetical protein